MKLDCSSSGYPYVLQGLAIQAFSEELHSLLGSILSLELASFRVHGADNTEKH